MPHRLLIPQRLKRFFVPRRAARQQPSNFFYQPLGKHRPRPRLQPPLQLRPIRVEPQLDHRIPFDPPSLLRRRQRPPRQQPHLQRPHRFLRIPLVNPPSRPRVQPPQNPMQTPRPRPAPAQPASPAIARRGPVAPAAPPAAPVSRTPSLPPPPVAAPAQRFQRSLPAPPAHIRQPSNFPSVSARRTDDGESRGDPVQAFSRSRYRSPDTVGGSRN